VTDPAISKATVYQGEVQFVSWNENNNWRKVKKCCKCKTPKAVEEFGKNSSTPDGLSYECKQCQREYNRSRQGTPARRAAAKRTRSKTLMDPAKKTRSVEQRKAWQQANAIKRHAHVTLNNAVRDGRVTKPSVCERCGAGGHIHGHHDDYSHPLAVRWLCTPCHGERHRELNAMRRTAP